MSLEFEIAPRRRVWEDSVNSWRSATVYHRSEWLDAIEEVTRRQAIRIVGSEKGSPLIALPIFETGIGPLLSLASPPPSLGIEFLGPIMPDRLLRDAKCETERIRVQRAALKWLHENYRRQSLCYLRMGPEIRDGRPFQWEGFHLEVRYTYRLNLENGLGTLFDSFHHSVRGDLKRSEGKVEIRAGGAELCAQIHEFITSKLQAQGLRFGPSKQYFESLYSRLGAKSFQPIGAYTATGLSAGAIVTFHGPRASVWQHVTAPGATRLPLTACLIWQALHMAAERGCTEFELVGANMPRLVAYKSKFRAELEPFLEASRGSFVGRSALAIYRQLRG